MGCLPFVLVDAKIAVLVERMTFANHYAMFVRVLAEAKIAVHVFTRCPPCRFVSVSLTLKLQ
jgi:hypothetical protein